VKKKAAVSTTAPPTGTSTPIPLDRPTLVPSLSADSTPTVSAMDAQIDETVSEIGDGEESVVSNKEGVTQPPSIPPPAVPAVPAPKKKAPAKPKAKAGPRKSKLAQEIHPISETVSATSAIEDLL